MKNPPGIAIAGALILLCLPDLRAEETALPVPPQDQGLPYTRSARPAARDSIGENIALYPGSRYAYVAGYRTRLDADDPLEGEAAPNRTPVAGYAKTPDTKVSKAIDFRVSLCRLGVSPDIERLTLASETPALHSKSPKAIGHWYESICQQAACR